MLYQFDGAVDQFFPVAADRPVNRQTFMLQGISVTWENESGTPTAPSTSESFVLGVDVEHNGLDMDFKVVSVDPTTPTPSLFSWLELIEDGPIPLPAGFQARALYTNTDALIVKVLFVGYWR